GGRPRPERKGDELVVVFEQDGDAAVLAACTVLAHTRALRSTGIAEVTWNFHAGVDCGQVEEQDGEVNGLCLNHAAKIAKQGDGREEATLGVLMPEAAQHCSHELADTGGLLPGNEVSFGEDGDQEFTVRPLLVQSAPVFARYVEGLKRTAAG